MVKLLRKWKIVLQSNSRILIGISKMFKAACLVLDCILNGTTQDHHYEKKWPFVRPLTNCPATYTFKYIPLDIELHKIRNCPFHLCISKTKHKVGTSLKLGKRLSNGTERTNSTAFGHQLHQSSTVAASHFSQFVIIQQLSSFNLLRAFFFLGKMNKNTEGIHHQCSLQVKI